MIKQYQNYVPILVICLVIYFGRALLSYSFDNEITEVDEWLDQNELGEYKKIFKDLGLTTLSSCGSPEALDRLPELPWAEERRLRRAAQLLQQRLVLRQWLATHRLQHAYPRLVSLDVSSLEDVYWLEDSTARHALDPKDFGAWSAARQSLPTGKEQLQTLKTDLWSAVVKNSRHQDAWTWGGMLVVSASVAGLVTLAAMTQPSLAPEAKHSLLQYVTGKYLQPAACRVEWGWQEPQSVGETMCFTIHCYQRNGQPYPICDTDELTVTIAHGTRKVEAVIELGSGEPAQANTARVKFTVRTAGVYIISVLIGGMPISGSPYRRCFVAGRVAARASRAGAGGALAALPCVAGRARPVPLHPRDKYDNAAEPSAALATGFSVSIAPLGSPPDPELTKFATLSYDAVNQRVMLTLCLPNPGVFKATVTYENEPVMNGEFDCIVLTPSDAATVQRNISAKRPHAHYPATLLSRGAPPGASPSPSDASPPAAPARGRRIVCCLTPMTVTLKDYWLHLIPKRIAAFRLKPNTKLILQPSSGGDGGGGGGRLTLDDGVQPALELHSAQRDLIVATFAQLLRNNCGNEDSFKNKQEYFYASVRAHHARLAHDKVSIVVSRDALLRSSYLATRHLAHADWRKSFDVTFRSEQGVDWGGVRREWFSLLCAAIFEHSGLFAPFGDQPNGLVRPNPHRDPSLKLKYYELAGKIVGKCIYESALGGCYRQLVRARLARSFRAQLLGLPTSYTHFEQDDPELWLSKVKYVLETDLEAAAEELYFSDDVYDARGRLLETRDLAPRGRDTRVTNANKVQYLEALARWRLVTQSRAESAAFLRGLALLVPDHLLSAFDENELELLVCGTAELSVADWRAHALVSGGGGAGGAGRARVLGWLWAALDNFSAEERARLLQFTTGCSQLPPGGFQELNPRFQITAAPTFGALPTAHTCFNQLCLPDYDSYEHLVHALLWAINEGGEGFGMI